MEEEEDEAVNAVFKAAREGDVYQVEMLLDGGPNLLEAKGSYDHRPLLFEASAYGHVGVVKHLLRRGANVNAGNMPGVRSIHQAASHGHADVVEVLLRAGAEISIPHMRGPGRWTALMAASLGGHKSVTQVLVHHMRGRGLNERDRDGRTALWWACQYGRGRVTRVLLLAGADRTIADNMGLTPRQIAQMTLGRNPCVIVLKVSMGKLLQRSLALDDVP
jgi:ankyrin repeat protein